MNYSKITRIENINVINPDDCKSNFWGNTYLILLTMHGIPFVVNAEHESAALDEVMDYCVKQGWQGLYSTDFTDYESDEYITAGNCGFKFTTHNITIERID